MSSSPVVATPRPEHLELHPSLLPPLGRPRHRPAIPPAPPLFSGLCEHLRHQPLFNVLPESLLTLLGAGAQLRRHGRDELIVEQGEIGHHLHLLLRGRAHVERTGAHAKVVLLDVLEPGERIGEMALIDGQPHNASVRSVLPCDVLTLKGSDVLQCLSHSPRFSEAWMNALVAGLRQANRRILSMSLHGVRERVLWRLQEWGEPIAPGTWLVSNRVGRNELARMVGASREMVCRVLRALEATGEIELRRDRSIVLRLALVA